jgi:hypothetical protein
MVKCLIENEGRVIINKSTMFMFLSSGRSKRPDDKLAF